MRYNVISPDYVYMYTGSWIYYWSLTYMLSYWHDSYWVLWSIEKDRILFDIHRKKSISINSKRFAYWANELSSTLADKFYGQKIAL